MLSLREGVGNVKTYYFGVDPGDSCGVAWLDVEERKLVAFQGSPHDALTFLELLLDRAEDDDVVRGACERFVSMRGRPHSQQPTAQRVVGAVEALADRYACSVTLQSPADARAMAPNELLRKLGWYQRGKELDAPDADDANMAVRHLLLLLAQTRASVFEALVRDCGWIRT